MSAVAVATAIAMPLVAVELLLNGTSPGALWTPGFWLLEPILALAVIGGSRFAIRAVNDIATARDAGERAGRVPALLFGAGSEGAAVARLALELPE